MQVSRAAKARPVPHDAGRRIQSVCLRHRGNRHINHRTMPVAPGQNERAERCRFPRILLAAPGSGSGKTLLTTGLLTLFQNRGIRCRSFKCGPDYIDPMFHKYVLGIDSCNLDSFSFRRGGLRALFRKRAADAELSILEGVMGYYDGIGGNSTAASTYEVAKITDTPVILVVDGKGSNLSLAAQIKGFLDYRKDSHICGVILNKTNKMVGERLRPRLKSWACVILARCRSVRLWTLRAAIWDSTMPQEQSELRGHLNAFAKQLEEYLDVDGDSELAGYSGEIAGSRKQPKRTGSKTGNKPPSDLTRHMAVAMDEAFCFYLRKILDFLKTAGMGS